ADVGSGRHCRRPDHRSWRKGLRGVPGPVRGRRHRNLVCLCPGAALPAGASAGPVRREDHRPRLIPSRLKMIYRENGQFKTTYRADQQIFPIAQDRLFIFALLLFAFLVVPTIASGYMFRAILIPFVIMSLAAVGVNILVGYCGQISLGSGAFMAVGAYGAYNAFIRIPNLPLVPCLIIGGLCATVFGILFGLPSLRVKGLYLAVATLAAQFFS